MSGLGSIELGLVVLVLAAAIWTNVARATFAAAVGFIAYGLLLALIWVRLGTVDVALTEAAVGAITGVLLLSAAARMRASEAVAVLERPAPVMRGLIAVLCIAVSVGIALVVLLPADPAPTLAPVAAANLHATGMGNPVTAVLMAYRAIDTLLEKIVLLVAVVAVWSMAPDSMWGGRPGLTPVRQGNEALVFLARLLPPIGVVVGIYLLWNGADEPGGAFQGGAILAAMWILARLAGLVDAPAIGRRSLRVALVAGPVVFLAAGFTGFALAEGFLSYPSGWEKPVIIVIETAMTLTVAVTLAMLLEGPPARSPSPPLPASSGAHSAKIGER
jgi:multisubunit Na+/H+ antiporter MnhB subunit